MSTKTSKPKTKEYYAAVGRRKTATARLRLYSKAGENIVNNKPIDVYFPGLSAKKQYELPFELTGTKDKFHFTAKVIGSGKVGQLKAIVHALTRTLVQKDEAAFKITLKQAGLLTRDPRKKERRKVGTGGKARRKKQSPKR